MVRHLFKESLRHLCGRWRSNLAVVLILGAGSTLGLAVFATLDAYLWTTGDVPDPDRVVLLLSRRGTETPQRSLASATFDRLHRSADCFAALGAWQEDLISVDLGEESLSVRTVRASAGTFATFGTQPQAGRFFSEEEDASDAPVLVISSAFWKSALGGAKDIIGRTVWLGQIPRTVIGIVDRPAREFDGIQAWIPLGRGERFRGDHTYAALRVTARLRPDCSVEQAQLQLDKMSAELHAEIPNQIPKNWSLVARSRRADQAAILQPVLWLLVGAGIGSLLVAGLNAAAVKVVGFAATEQQLAIKRALGASTGILLGPLLAEGIVLACAGALLGGQAATWGLRFLQRDPAAFLPRDDGLTIGGHFPLAVVAIATLTAPLLTCLPALRTVMSTNWSRQLQQRHASERALRRFQRLAIVFQLAVAFALIVSSGRLLRGWQELRRIDLGFDASRASTFSLGSSREPNATPERLRSHAIELQQALAGVGGVTHAAICTSIPLTSGWMIAYHVHGDPVRALGELPKAATNFVSPEYLPTMGLRLRAGRWFLETDTAGAQLVAVINTTLARAHFPAGDAVGKWIFPAHGDKAWRLIVGVVDDVRLGSLIAPAVPQIYEPFSQHPFASFTMVFTSAPDHPAPTAKAIRSALARVAGDRPMGAIYRFQQYQEAKFARQRFTALVVLAVAVFSVALCIAGFASLVSYAAARRTREFGLRLALGATGRDIVRGLFGESLRLGAAGVALGLLGAFLLNQTLDKLVTLPAQTQVFTHGIAILVLVLVTFIATAAPAWRASRIDPAKALREE